MGRIEYRPEGAMAGAMDMKITVKGKPSHGAYPWLSVDPIVTAAQIITSLQTLVSRNLNIVENGAVVTIGAIHGGNRSNIISEQVEMTGTVRTLSRADDDFFIKRINEIAKHTAEAAGATAIVVIAANDPVPGNLQRPEAHRPDGAQLGEVGRQGKCDLVKSGDRLRGFLLLHQRRPC